MSGTSSSSGKAGRNQGTHTDKNGIVYQIPENSQTFPKGVDYAKIFPEKLERARKLAKPRPLTQKALALRCGMSENTLSSYARGEKFPSLMNLVKMADVLQVSIDYLLGRAGYYKDGYEQMTLGKLARQIIVLVEVSRLRLETTAETSTLICKFPLVNDFLIKYQEYKKMLDDSNGNPAIKDMFDSWKAMQLNSLDDELLEFYSM